MSSAARSVLQRRRAVFICVLTALIASEPPPERASEVASGAAEIVALTLVPQEVAAGTQASGSIRFDSATLTALRVDLTSGNPAIARVPASVVTVAGARSTVFPIQTFAESPGCARITARAGAAAARFDQLFVIPPTDQQSPVNLRLESNAVVATGNALAYVQLAHAAPAGGTNVHLASSSPSVATVPASIVVPPAATKQRFLIHTAPVASSTCAVISAVVAGNTSKALLKIVGTSR